MKQFATIVAAAALVQAKVDPDAVSVKTYTTEDCTSTPQVHETLFTGDCVTIKNAINVKELNDAKFNIIKKSGDDANEFYMFPNTEACKEYGNKFNKDIEVAFIRAPSRGKCFPCQNCGDVKSIKFADVTLTEKETPQNTNKNKEDSGAASTTVATSSALVVSAIVAMLF